MIDLKLDYSYLSHTHERCKNYQNRKYIYDNNKASTGLIAGALSSLLVFQKLNIIIHLVTFRLFFLGNQLID